jgi:hypothetical protein
MNYRSTKKRNSYELKFATIATSVLLAFFSVFLTWKPSYAGTVKSVSGTVTDGQTITIKGSGFGSAGPKMHVFDDFESGTPGANIKTGAGSAKFGTWDVRQNTSYYGTSAKVSGTKSFTADMSGKGPNSISSFLPSNTRDYFISWWIYLPANNNWPGEVSSDAPNWKTIWALDSDGHNDLVIGGNLTGKNWILFGNESTPDYNKYFKFSMVKGKWQRAWAWFKGSTTATSNDGEVKFWDLSSTGVLQRVNSVGVNNLKSLAQGGKLDRININGWGRTEVNCTPSFDDVYIATGPNAQARIEVGNASTYAESTKLTILTPKSWSDGSISAQVNTGPFKTGEPAYLFVFKADGSVSSGYPIKIGATASGDSNTVVPPPAPNLRLKK